MTTMDEAFRAAALALEDDLRKIDAGEIQATPARRAFIAGAVRGWKRSSAEATGQRAEETGGYSVDPARGIGAHGSQGRSDKGLSADETENLDLAASE